jgi:hypothetical protein
MPRQCILTAAERSALLAFPIKKSELYENKQLIFVAKVKNGFVSRIRNELFPVLKALQTAQCPMPRHRWKFSPPWGMEDLN